MSILNESRARWAELALKTFETQAGTEGEDSVSDLIANLGHMCDERGIDFKQCLERGAANHDEEKERNE